MDEWRMRRKPKLYKLKTRYDTEVLVENRLRILRRYNMAQKIYPESEKIDRIVKSNGWSLYDTLQHKTMKKGTNLKC